MPCFVDHGHGGRPHQQVALSVLLCVELCCVPYTVLCCVMLQCVVLPSVVAVLCCAVLRCIVLH